MKQKTVTQRQFWTWLLIFVIYLVIESIGFFLIPQWMGYKGKLPIFALNNPPPYSASQALAFIDEYGSAGRTAYSVALVFDVFFPFLYATVLSVGLQLVLQSTRLSQGVQWVIARVPFLAALANWIADIFILLLLISPASRVSVIATLASILTTFKFVVLGLSVIGFLLGVVYLLGRSIFSKRKPSAL